jgi:dTDP-L-rhamnose 4-epimerase
MAPDSHCRTHTPEYSIFSNLARCGKPIRVFEDGCESRDFVYVEDVVTATVQALLAPVSGCHVLNVGSGEPTTVLTIAEQVNAYFGGHSEIQITGEFREGDIRHGFADLTAVKQILSFEPRWNFAQGLDRFLRWAEQFPPTAGGYELSLEMRSKGFLHA